MPSIPPEDVLPVLVADLEDEDAREVLEAAANSGGRVFVPLGWFPMVVVVNALSGNRVPQPDAATIIATTMPDRRSFRVHHFKPFMRIRAYQV